MADAPCASSSSSSSFVTGPVAAMVVRGWQAPLHPSLVTMQDREAVHRAMLAVALHDPRPREDPLSLTNKVNNDTDKVNEVKNEVKNDALQTASQPSTTSHMSEVDDKTEDTKERQNASVRATQIARESLAKTHATHARLRALLVNEDASQHATLGTNHHHTKLPGPDTGLDFKVWDCSQAELYGVVLGMFARCGLLASQDARDTLLAFVIDVAKSYMDNPYHTFLHAVDVTYILFYTLTDLRLRDLLDLNAVHVASLLIAALAHDALHPGLNNVYQVNAQTSTAQKFNGRSVLERLSIEELNRLLDIHPVLTALNIDPTAIAYIESLHGTPYTTYMRSLMDDMILHTDMCFHFDLLKRLGAVAEELGGPIDNSFYDDYDEYDDYEQPLQANPNQDQKTILTGSSNDIEISTSEGLNDPTPTHNLATESTTTTLAAPTINTAVEDTSNLPSIHECNTPFSGASCHSQQQQQQQSGIEERVTKVKFSPHRSIIEVSNSTNNDNNNNIDNPDSKHNIIRNEDYDDDNYAAPRLSGSQGRRRDTTASDTAFESMRIESTPPQQLLQPQQHTITSTTGTSNVSTQVTDSLNLPQGDPNSVNAFNDRRSSFCSSSGSRRRSRFRGKPQQGGSTPSGSYVDDGNIPLGQQPRQPQSGKRGNGRRGSVRSPSSTPRSLIMPFMEGSAYNSLKMPLTAPTATAFTPIPYPADSSMRMLEKAYGINPTELLASRNNSQSRGWSGFSPVSNFFGYSSSSGADSFSPSHAESYFPGGNNNNGNGGGVGNTSGSGSLSIERRYDGVVHRSISPVSRMAIMGAAANNNQQQQQSQQQQGISDLTSGNHPQFKQGRKRSSAFIGGNSPQSGTGGTSGGGGGGNISVSGICMCGENNSLKSSGESLSQQQGKTTTRGDRNKSPAESVENMSSTGTTRLTEDLSGVSTPTKLRCSICGKFKSRRGSLPAGLEFSGATDNVSGIKGARRPIVASNVQGGVDSIMDEKDVGVPRGRQCSCRGRAHSPNCTDQVDDEIADQTNESVGPTGYFTGPGTATTGGILTTNGIDEGSPYKSLLREDEGYCYDDEGNELVRPELTEEQRRTLLIILLHAADISNAARPFDICKAWSDMVVEEFFLQGEQEKVSNLPISPNMDRETTAPSQIGFDFNEFVVRPFFEDLAELIPTMKVFVEHLWENGNLWEFNYGAKQ